MPFPPPRLLATSAVALSIAAPALAQDWDWGEPNVPEFRPAFENQTRAPKIEDRDAVRSETFATGLENPWGIALLPDGSYLVTERPGRLRHVAPDGTVSEPIAGVPEVLAEDQGGLLDVALAPDFAESRRVFLTYSRPVGELSATVAGSGVLSGDMRELSDWQILFTQDPPSPTPLQYGSRILFDGEIAYITTGERYSDEERVFAQDVTRTYGKVVRMNASGGPAEGNPFADQGTTAAEVYTLGHRNVQGAALDAEGTLWTLEHGPAGGDELNRIEAGANYGWPEVSYGEDYDGTPVGTGQPRGEGFVEPVYYWDPVIAPGGFVFYEGDLFPGWEGDILAASLSPGGIVRLDMEGGRVAGEARYLSGENRIRDVEIAPDGAILALVDDPEGSILRITPRDGTAQPAD